MPPDYDGTLPPVGDPPEINMPEPDAAAPATQSVAPPPTTARFIDLFATVEQLQQPPAAKVPLTTPADFPPPQVTQPLSTPPASTILTAPPTLIQAMEQKPKPVPRQARTPDPLDDPVIGGRFTVCVCLYGNYHEMHTSCLNSILSTIPASRRQIRVACNEVCNATLNYLSRLQSEQAIYKVMISPTNLKKYPAMRRMFWDDEPITDNWIVWFDDDSIANRDPAWSGKLAQAIIAAYDNGCRFFGAAHIWSFNASQREWIKSRAWYKGRPFQLKNGTEAPNGEKVIFPVGGFWAMETKAMREAGIPDEQIGNNGGDYMIAEQLWQAGYKMKNWNGQKQFIHTSSVKRRGLSEKHTGASGWVPGGNT